MNEHSGRRQRSERGIYRDFAILTEGPFQPRSNRWGAFTFPDWFPRRQVRHLVALGGPVRTDVRRLVRPQHGTSRCQPQNLNHVPINGHPSVIRYKDLVQLWKAERFDPDALKDLYERAGARTFDRPDGTPRQFFNYDSRVQPFNSARMGRTRTLWALWQAAARKHKLRFGKTEHLSASFEWLNTNKGCDATGPLPVSPTTAATSATSNSTSTTPDTLTSEAAQHYTLDPRWPPSGNRAVQEMVDTTSRTCSTRTGCTVLPPQRRDGRTVPTSQV